MILGFPKGDLGLDSVGSTAAHWSASVAQLEQHMARELHDQVAQPLITLLLDVYELRSQARSPESMAYELARIEESVRRVLRQTRETVIDLRGQSGIRLNFVQVVRNELGRRADSAMRYEATLWVSPRWPGQINGWAAFNLLRIVQESVANASRHGRARKIEIILDVRDADLAVLQVLDDGLGIEDAAVGFGMAGMEERALILGGRFEALPRPGGGTVIEVSFPLHRLE